MKTFTLALLLIQTAFAAACVWSCFCHLVRTDADTIREVRWTIWFEGLVAGLVAIAPILPLTVPELAGAWPVWTTPDWLYVLAVVAMTLMQLVTARYWGGGVPRDFQRSRLCDQSLSS